MTTFEWLGLIETLAVNTCSLLHGDGIALQLLRLRESAMDGSITRLVLGVRDGSNSAATQLWDHFASKLYRLAETRLRNKSGMCGSEDIALDAFYSFLKGQQNGRFSELTTRDQAWRMLAVIVIRKAINALRYEHRQRRNRASTVPRATVDLAAQAHSTEETLSPYFHEGAHSLNEIMEELLAKLDDIQLRQIAIDKLFGYTNQEIARKQGCSLATVERRLRLIRARWEGAVTP